MILYKQPIRDIRLKSPRLCGSSLLRISAINEELGPHGILHFDETLAILSRYQLLIDPKNAL